MRILIDVGHPAHIHYFKNCVKILGKKGHELLFVVRERDSTIELIRNLGFNYVSRGKGAKGLINKMFAIPKIDYKLWKIARRFKPDMFLSMCSSYAAHVAWIMRKPHICFDDTEHAKFEHLLCYPFSRIILSPSCYYAPLHKRQRLFKSYLELLYLHPHYFTPDKRIKQALGVEEGEKYCVLRLISWDANHDVNQHGLSYGFKLKMVKELEKHCHIFISSEEPLSDEFKKYKLKIRPHQLHDVLAMADLYIGEGSTTASESAVLGTPAIYINTLRVGNMEDEERYGLAFHMSKPEEILAKAISILSVPDSKSEFAKKRELMLKDKIDPTAMMVDLIENYPQSTMRMLNQV